MSAFTIPVSPEKFSSLKTALAKIAKVTEVTPYTGTVSGTKHLLVMTIKIAASYVYDPKSQMLTVTVTQGPADRIADELKDTLAKIS